MKRVIAIALLSISVCYANPGKEINFPCKNAYKQTIDKLVAFSMIRLNSVESARGAIYEANMGKEAYLEAMKKTYEELREEHPQTTPYSKLYDFSKFISPISELKAKINKKNKDINISYDEIASFISEGSEDKTFCPDDRAMSLIQIRKMINSSLK